MDFNECKRIVIKIGTSTLTHENGRLNLSVIEKLVRAVANLYNQGKEVILVTSGAIGVGVGILRLDKRPSDTIEKQAVAAVGQSELMNIYSKIFMEYGIYVGQILLTKDAVENDERRKNVTNTFDKLLKMKILPIVNENDSVSVEEIEFGDNDTLSAMVGSLVSTDLLILLSDIDGLYNDDPRENHEAELIGEIREITPEIEKFAKGKGSDRGTGGMQTKINAAKIALKNGFPMIIVNGKDPQILNQIFEGPFRGTLFIDSSQSS